jgi:hypothetical protein
MSQFWHTNIGKNIYQSQNFCTLRVYTYCKFLRDQVEAKG